MRKCSLLAILFAVNILGALNAQDDWHLIKSSDGAIEALLPGPPKRKLDKTKSLAGTIVTKIMEFHTDEVEFSVSSTRLSRFVRAFADDERLYKNAKDGVLNRFFGKAISYEEIEVDGLSARELHYEVVDFQDEAHQGYHGVAVFLVLNDKVYAANALMAKDAGKSDLMKFRDSIKINKRPEEQAK